MEYSIDWTSLILTGACPAVVLIASIISNRLGRLSKNAMSIITISSVYQIIHLFIWGFMSRNSTVFGILGPVVSAALMMLTAYLLRTYLPNEEHTWLTVLLSTEAVLSVILSVYTFCKEAKIRGTEEGKVYLVRTYATQASTGAAQASTGAAQKTGAVQASTGTAQKTGAAQASIAKKTNAVKETTHFAIFQSWYAVCAIIGLLALCGSITGHSYLMNHVYKGNITEYPRAFNTLITTIFFGNLIVYYYIVLILTDGGYIRNGQYIILKAANSKNIWSYCDQCSTFKPPRTIHCSECKKCVEQYDHHCPWLNKCVGKNNITLFHIFIKSLMVLVMLIVFSWLSSLVWYLKHKKRSNTTHQVNS